MGCAPAVLDIIAILIKDPENTKSILHKMNQGDYLGLVTQILDTAARDPELEKYLVDNKKVYSGLVKGLMQGPIREGEKGQVLYELLKFYELDVIIKNQPIVGFLVEQLISKPDKLKAALDAYQKGGVSGYLNMGQEILLLLQNAPGKKAHLDAIRQQDPDKKDPLDGIRDITNALANKIPALRDMIRRRTNADIGTQAKKIVQGGMGIVGSLDKVVDVAAEYIGHAFERMGYQIFPQQAEMLGGVIKKGKDLGQTDLEAILSDTAIQNEIDELTASEKARIMDIYEKGTEYENALQNLLKNWEEAKAYALKGALDFTAFDNVDFSGLTIPNKFTFIKTNFTNCNFVNTNLKNVSFQEGVLTNISFEGAVLNGVSFYYTQFKNQQAINFKNATLTRVNFEGITTSQVIDLQGATIDRYTLASIAKAVQEKPALKDKFNFSGAKIKGDLSGLNLSGVSLRGADLTGVTSMKGSNLKGTDIREVKCGDTTDKAWAKDGILFNLFKNTINFEQATQEQDKYLQLGAKRQREETQEKLIAEKVAETIVDFAIYEDKISSSSDRKGHIQRFKDDLFTRIKRDEQLKTLLGDNFHKIGNTFFLPKAISNYSELSKQPQAQFLRDMYEFYSNGKSMEEAYRIARKNVVAHLIADTIGKELFGEEGKNRRGFCIIKKAF